MVNNIKFYTVQNAAYHAINQRRDFEIWQTVWRHVSLKICAIERITQNAYKNSIEKQIDELV